MRRVAIVIALTVTGLIGLNEAPASAVSNKVDAEVKPVIQLVDQGTGAIIQIRARCPSGYTVQEALVYIVQDGNTSSMRGFTLPCDGRWYHRTVRVETFGDPFHEGKAFATSYLLVFDGQDTLDGGRRRKVKLAA